MESKTAEVIMTSKKLFARLLAKYIGTDEDPDIATEMIGKDSEVTALYNTCLEFSAICNDLTQQQLAEKDKEIDKLNLLVVELQKYIRKQKFENYQRPKSTEDLLEELLNRL